MFFAEVAASTFAPAKSLFELVMTTVSDAGGEGNRRSAVRRRERILLTVHGARGVRGRGRRAKGHWHTAKHFRMFLLHTTRRFRDPPFRILSYD